MNLADYYGLCLGAKYTHTAESGDYCIKMTRDTLYLLFEWSDGKEDWKNNFDFPVRTYKNGACKWRCHRGFTKVWKAMRDEIEAKVGEALAANSSIEKIICIGYSHGGALAVLATEDMAYLYGDTLAVTGFGYGAPRVLWGRVPNAVRERLKGFTTIRNASDIVTHLPPLLFGFKNAGELLTISEWHKYTPIKAHYPNIYETELKRWVENGGHR